MPADHPEPQHPDERLQRDPIPYRSDPQRLDAVRRTGLLDSGPEESFDRLTRLAARLVVVPATFLSIVDERRDFYKSCFGFPEPLASTRVVASPSFCEYAIMSRAPLRLNDVTTIPGLRDIPQVKLFGIRAYLGIPMVTDTGEIVGSFCAVDLVPRYWTDHDVEVMTELAESANREIALRAAVARAQRHAARAQSSVRAREEVLAVVAHDLRTPLGVIANSSSALSRMPLSEPALESVNAMRAATRSMSGLINDLLDMSRFDAGHLQLHRQEIRPDVLVHDAVAMMAPLAAKYRIGLIDAVPTDLPSVDADYERLLRVFANLVSNAIKFSGAGTEIRFSAELDGGHVRFSVTDRGTGMTSGQLAQMFTKFWQADSSDRRGAGLGLPIAREIVEAHGGAIDALSDPGTGSTFRFTLPAYRR